MPIYEYACKRCDAKFEQLVRSMNSETKVKCPECGSSQTARALSVFAVGAESAAGAPAAPACCPCGSSNPCGMG